MGNYDEYYEKVFGDINIGDKVRVYKEGTIYEGELIFKNKYYFTLQLPYYREGFSIPDFLMGHSKLCAEGEEIDMFDVDDDMNPDIDDIDGDIDSEDIDDEDIAEDEEE